MSLLSSWYGVLVFWDGSSDAFGPITEEGLERDATDEHAQAHGDPVEASLGVPVYAESTRGEKI